MPIVIIIIGLAIAVGLGSYFLRPQETSTPSIEIPAVETVSEVQNGATVPDEVDDNAESGVNISPEPGDNPAETAEEETSVYGDGSYDVNIAYTTPNRTDHKVAVTIVLANDVITNANISFSGDEVATSKKYQASFVAAYKSQVIGKNISTVQLSRVGGASLTTNTFNDALVKVKEVAQN